MVFIFKTHYYSPGLPATLTLALQLTTHWAFTYCDWC